MKDLEFNIDFFTKRVPSYLVLIPIFILSLGHIYFEKDINILILTDLVILCSILFTLPEIKISNEEETTHLISKNMGGYSLLLVVIIPSSLFEFFNYFIVNDEFFHIMTSITGAAFGVNKLRLNRQNILDNVVFYKSVNQELNEKAQDKIKETRTKNVNNINSIASTKNNIRNKILTNSSILEFNKGQFDLPENIINIKKYFKPNNLVEAALLFIGVQEIKGNKHNSIILKFGEWAKIHWYNKDEIAWCAVFVNAMLYLINKQGTRSALAKSFLNIGVKVTLKEVIENPINVVLIFNRGESVTEFGHVEILKTISDTYYSSIGGNVGDKVVITENTIESLKTKKLISGERSFIQFRRII
jgi:uncharacterized protein (TIGR02594 family)